MFSISIRNIINSIILEMMTEEEIENWENVNYRMNAEGFDSCFRNYSRFEEIEDDEFHRLREEYLESSQNLREYITQKYEEAINQ